MKRQPLFRIRRFGAVVPILGAAAAIAACSPAPSASPSAGSGGPSAGVPATPAPTTPSGGVDHATGATDVVLRFEEGGGFVPMGFFATEAPIFTLYGDGTVIFKDGFAAPPPADDGIIRVAPYMTVTLTEEQIQTLLQFAIADGALGVARAQYQGVGADLPTATFTLVAAGTKKTVSVSGLGMDGGATPETPVLQALAGLGDRLRNFAPNVEGEVAWVPDRWRGVLTEDPGGGAPRAWPWPGVTPKEWIQQQEPTAPQFPVREMSPAEIDALELQDIGGGFSGMVLTGPDGKRYFFAIRPLFPDEAY